jgi:hypothetical protein
MIISPTYHGKHSYSKYEELTQQLIDTYNIKETTIINVDFLYRLEVGHYFDNFFCPYYCELIDPQRTFIESKETIKLKLIRKLLKKHMIRYTRNQKKRKRYRIEVL